MQAQTTAIPYGYCHCGCGQKTKPVHMTSKARGVVQGEPCRYIMGHNRRKGPDDYRIDPETGCWVWLRTTYRNGYAATWDTASKKLVIAHRLYYERHKGAIPEGLHVDHLCGVRACVNPDHLEAVTVSENNLRAWTVRRRNKESA